MDRFYSFRNQQTLSKALHFGKAVNKCFAKMLPDKKLTGSAGSDLTAKQQAKSELVNVFG